MADTPAHLYLVTGPSGKQYVGITRQTVAARWAQHVRDAARALSKSALHAAIRKYGEAEFSVTTLAALSSWESACVAETDEILTRGTFGRKGYNLTLGGEGMVGYKHTDAFKLQASARMLGVPRPEISAKLSAAHARRTPEQRTAIAEKMAAANARRTPEDVARISSVISASKRGIPRTPEVIAKMTASASRAPVSPEVKARIKATRDGFSPEKRAAISEKISAFHANQTPEQRERANRARSATTTGSIRSPEARANLKAACARRTPEQKAAIAQKMAATNALRTPEEVAHIRALRSAAMLASHAARRAVRAQT